MESGERPSNSGFELDPVDCEPGAEGEIRQGAAANAGTPLAVGESIGRFQVLSLLGQGGMGAVYKAYDPVLDRSIAIKILKVTAAPGQSQTKPQARLLREAQALAQVTHPNVIAVHDVGNFGEDVFVAMEYIQGQTLRSWLKERPRSLSEILPFFIAAGRGLQAAHAAGLVHRDFKPDNVFIDETGRVRVLDFGLARGAEEPEESPRSDRPRPDRPRPDRPRPDRPRPDQNPPSGDEVPQEIVSTSRQNLLTSDLTQAGRTVGTPGYMSPEQYLHDRIDPRSDQWSFAVALYEALTGRRPFAGRTLREVRASTLQGRFRPFRAEDRVPGWLQRLIGTALAVNPDERHPHMGALLDALERNPARRRQRLLAAAAILAVLAASGAVAWTALGRTSVCQGARHLVERSLRPDWRVALEKAFLSSGRSHAAFSARQVTSLLDRYTAEWEDQRTEACLATRVRGEQSERMLDLRMHCLDVRLKRAVALIGVFTDASGPAVVDRAIEAVSGLEPLRICADRERLDGQPSLPDDPATRERIALLGREIARIEALSAAGLYDGAGQLLEALLKAAKEVDYPPLQVEALFEQADYQELRGAFRDTLLTLRKAADGAARARLDARLAEAWGRMAWIRGHRLAEIPAALALLEVAETAVRRVGSPDDLTLLVLRTAGAIALGRADYEGARARFEEACDLIKRSYPGDRLKEIACLNNLGTVYGGMGEDVLAERAFRKSLAMKRELLGDEHPGLLGLLGNLCIALNDRGQLDEALDFCEQALALCLRTFGRNHPETAIALGNKAQVLARQEKLDEAERLHRERLAVLERSFGPQSPRVATALLDLGALAIAAGRTEEAFGLAVRARDIALASSGSEDQDQGYALERMAEARLAQRRHAEAQVLFVRALGILERAFGAESPSLINPLRGQADCALALGRPREALAPLERALGLLEGRRADPAERGEVCFSLAKALIQTGGDRSRAIRLAGRAIEELTRADRAARNEERIAAIRLWIAGLSRRR